MFCDVCGSPLKSRTPPNLHDTIEAADHTSNDGEVSCEVCARAEQDALHLEDDD